MSIHKTDRNIVMVNSMGSVADVAFGPSDDDFHYQRDHGTISHANEHGHATSDSQIGIKLIFQGNGCEVQWSGTDTARNEHSWDGYLNVNPDGMLSFPFWSVDDAGDQRVPFWIEFTDTGLKVFTYEGQPPEDEREQWLVFDSNTIK